ncbi:MAG: electron transport complex subunit E [Spongiibacteraceae bacterium]|jgi:electron transport complex protein RnfE|nr:electron transport complex subunit E [Spongiibacteraceae bacterium]
MAEEVNYRELTFNGLWKNNPALVQLLGLCPLLAVTTNVVNALGLGAATLFVLLISNLAVSLIRSIVSDAIRLAVFVMIIAAAVTCVELLMQAFAYELYMILGIFLPLITTNCIILGRADGFARKHGLLPSAVDGVMMGAGMAAAMIVLGGLREAVGTGALFADMHLLFGESARAWRIVLVDGYQSFLLAILPPGAFIFTGLLIALKNLINDRLAARAVPATPSPVTDRRVRVTGQIS